MVTGAKAGREGGICEEGLKRELAMCRLARPKASFAKDDPGAQSILLQRGNWREEKAQRVVIEGEQERAGEKMKPKLWGGR